MLETVDRSGPLAVFWRERLSIISLRGHSEDAAFLEVAQAALGLAVPTVPCRTVEGARARIVWAGPDDWFVIQPAARADALERRLREGLVGLHAAITDVSSGYAVLSLSGSPARDVLAQGCPLDLHPRAFGPGCASGTHFFKASVWLWQPDAAPVFEMLVRRSFRGYVAQMLERSTRECGLHTESPRP